MRIDLPQRLVGRVLATAIGTAVLAGWYAEWAWHSGALESSGWVRRAFSLSEEHNLPTWLSSGLLLACSVLLAVIGLGRRQVRAPYSKHWLFLSLVFLYISIDEALIIHEYASLWLDLDGIFYFSWVVPASAVVAVLGAVYWRFLQRLEARMRGLFLRAATAYVGGALGVELLLGWWTSFAGSENILYSMIDLVEESLEMVGAAWFLLALLEYAGGRSGLLEVRLADLPPTHGPDEAVHPEVHQGHHEEQVEQKCA